MTIRSSNAELDAAIAEALELARALRDARTEIERLEALFQRTHGVHSSWVAEAERLRTEIERKDAALGKAPAGG